MRGAHSKCGMSIWTEPVTTTGGFDTVAVFDNERPNDAIHIRDAGQLEEFINLLISCGHMHGWTVKHSSTWPEEEPNR